MVYWFILCRPLLLPGIQQSFDGLMEGSLDPRAIIIPEGGFWMHLPMPLQWSEKLINLERLAGDMRLNNQAKVGLACVACLLVQGYIFTYVLFVEPHPFLSIVPLFPYLVYVYARGKRTWYFNKPFYWIGLIIFITLLDILPFAVAAMRAWSPFPAEAFGFFPIFWKSQPLLLKGGDR